MQNITDKEFYDLTQCIQHWNTMEDLDISKLDINDFNAILLSIPSFNERRDAQGMINRLITLMLYVIQNKHNING